MIYLISLILLLLPTYLIRFQIWRFPTNLLEVIIILIFFYWLIYIKNKKFPALKFILPIIFFVMAAIISIIISPDKSVALGIFKSWIIIPILFGFMVFGTLKKGNFENNIKILNLGLIFGGLVVSLQAIWQKIAGHVTIDGRVMGIFGLFPNEYASPNFLALYLAPIAVLSFSIFILSKNWTKWLNLIIFVILTIAVFFSGSRGGLLAVIAGAIFVIYFFIMSKWPKFKLIWQIILLIILLSGALTLWQVAKPNFNLSSGRIASSNNIRWEIWKSSWQIVKAHPILGIGLGDFQNYFIDHFKDKPGYQLYIVDQAYSPHNLYLALWLNLGLLGIITFIWLLYLFFKVNNFIPSIPFWSAMIAILAYGLIDTPYFKNDLSLIFWTLIFITFSLQIKISKTSKEG